MNDIDLTATYHRAQSFLADSNVASLLQQPATLEEYGLKLVAVYTHQPTAVSADQLARLAQQLISHERAPGGPYRSRVDRSDHFLNAVVGCLLQKMGQPLPKVQSFLRKAVVQQTLDGPIMPALTLYYASQALESNDHSAVMAYAHALSSTATSPLQTALLLATLRIAGYPTADPAAVQLLVNSQQADGSWPIETTGLSTDSSKLTTTFITGAIKQLLPQQYPQQDPTQCAVFSRAQQACHDNPAALRQRMHDGLEYIIAADKNKEIALLPHFFATALNSQLPSTLVQTLGVANVFCWLAYTIYDDILDEEPHAGQYLPTANSALRQAFLHYQQAGCNSRLVHQAYALMDNANSWELAQCRFNSSEGCITIGTLPRYGNRRVLAHRSWGHALGPLAVLQVEGYQATSRPFRLISKGLQHYLIARQLNDDIHDWQADLRQGQISCIVADMLRSLAILPGEYDCDQLVARMKRHFLRQGFQRYNTLIMAHVHAARIAYQQSGIISEGAFTQLLDAIESSIKKSQANLVSAKKLLKRFTANQ